MSTFFGLAYGAFAYAVGFGSLAYAALFLNNVGSPRTIDAGVAPSAAVAVAINVGLAMLFAVQHSLMARKSFKRWLTRMIPAFAERSTYVLASGVALVVLYLFWQPLPASVWSVENEGLRIGLWALQGFGWLFLIAATFMLSHTELFGLQQVWDHAQGNRVAAPYFRSPGLYRFVRHPIQLGVLIIFWATPDMSVGRLILCGAITGYIIVALRFFEEPDLIREFGDTYRDYRKRVGMLLPKFGG
jgi:protein-S-isoprenylcysteine O-methyltransferase Ste14